MIHTGCQTVLGSGRDRSKRFVSSMGGVSGSPWRENLSSSLSSGPFQNCVTTIHRLASLIESDHGKGPHFTGFIVDRPLLLPLAFTLGDNTEGLVATRDAFVSSCPLRKMFTHALNETAKTEEDPLRQEPALIRMRCVPSIPKRIPILSGGVLSAMSSNFKFPSDPSSKLNLPFKTSPMVVPSEYIVAIPACNRVFDSLMKQVPNATGSTAVVLLEIISVILPLCRVSALTMFLPIVTTDFTANCLRGGRLHGTAYLFSFVVSSCSFFLLQ